MKTRTIVVSTLVAISALCSTTSFASSIADALVKKGEYDQAYEVLKRDAAAGDAMAYSKAGDLVINGVVQGLKPESGVALFKKGAEAGDPDAMMRMAFFYKTGFLGVPLDPAKEEAYLVMATKRGSALAYSALGWLQLTSQNPHILNPKDGLSNLNRSVSMGSPFGMARLGSAYWLGLGGLQVNQVVGLALYKYAKKRGLEGSESRIEDKELLVMRAPGAAQGVSELLRSFATKDIVASIDTYKKSSGASFDYRNPTARPKGTANLLGLSSR